MPRVQLIILWVGLIGDIITKGSLTFQLVHLAMRHMWVNFGVILGGYIVSSSFVSPSAYRLAVHTALCYKLSLIAPSDTPGGILLDARMAPALCLRNCAMPAAHEAVERVQVTAYWLSHYPTRIADKMTEWRTKSEIDLERRSRPAVPDGGISDL
jgi:hypothetical protein